MESGFKATLKDAIRTIPDYPKPGVQFRDVTTLMGDAQAFRRAVDELVYPYAGNKVDKVAGIEARGFILGGAIAHQLSAGFVPIRKKGKLPRDTVRIAYSLEYGIDEMEMHRDTRLLISYVSKLHVPGRTKLFGAGINDNIVSRLATKQLFRQLIA